MLVVDAMTGDTIDSKLLRRRADGQPAAIIHGRPVMGLKECWRTQQVGPFRFRIPGSTCWSLDLQGGGSIPLVERRSHPNFFGRRVLFIPS